MTQRVRTENTIRPSSRRHRLKVVQLLLSYVKNPTRGQSSNRYEEIIQSMVIVSSTHDNYIVLIYFVLFKHSILLGISCHCVAH